MISDSEKLQSLISIYICLQDKLEFRTKRADEQPVFAITLLIAIFGTQIFSNISNIDYINFILIITALIIPIIVITSLQKAAHEHTYVAILRGHSAYLEHEINLILGKDYIIFNKQYIDRYIDSQTLTKSNKIAFSHISTSIAGITPTIICFIIVLYNINFLDILKNDYLICAYILICIIFTIYLILSIKATKLAINTQSKRKDAYMFLYELNKPSYIIK